MPDEQLLPNVDVMIDCADLDRLAALLDGRPLPARDERFATVRGHYPPP